MNHTAMTMLTSRLPQRRESSRIPGPNQNSSHHQNSGSFPVIKKFGSLVRPNFSDNSSGNINIPSSSSTNSNQSINQFPAHQQQAQNPPPSSSSSSPSVRSNNDDRTTDNPSDTPSISNRGLRSSRINSPANSLSFPSTTQIGSNRINLARPNFSAKYVPSPTLPPMNTINNGKSKSRSSSVKENDNLDLNNYSQRSQSTSSSHDKSGHFENRFDSRLGLSNSYNSNFIYDSNRPSPASGLGENDTLKRSFPRPLIHPKPISATSLKNSSSPGHNESGHILTPKSSQSNSTSYHANMIPPMVSSMTHPNSSITSRTSDNNTSTTLSNSVHSNISTPNRGSSHQLNSGHQATILRRPSSGIPRTGSIRDTLPARNVQPERKISLNMHGSGKDYRRSCSPIDVSLVCPENMIPAKSESNVARVSPIMRTIRHQPSNTNSLGTISVVTSSSSTSSSSTSTSSTSTSPSFVPASSSVVSNSRSNSSSTTSMTTITTASEKEDRMENDGKEIHTVSNGLNLNIKEHSAKILAHKNAPSNATGDGKSISSLSSCTLSSSTSPASTISSSCSFSPHPSFTTSVNKAPTSTTNSVSTSNGNQKMFLKPVIEECTSLSNGKSSTNSNNNNNNNVYDKETKFIENGDKIKYSTVKSRPNWSHKSNLSNHVSTVKDDSNRSSSSSMEESECKEITKADALLNKLKLTETIIDTKPPNQLSSNLYSNHHLRHSIILSETEANSILGSIKPLPEPRSLSFRSGSTTLHPQSQSTTDPVNQNGLSTNSSSGLNLSLLQLRRLSKTGDLRGSALSLLSNSSSFSASEERHNQEAKKLKEDLNRANIKIETLTSQLKNSVSGQNDMITTFNQSLEALRTRLQQSCLTINQKEREISRLKATMEVLRREFQSDTLSRRGGAPCSDIDTRKEKQRKRSKDRTPLSDQEESSSNSSWFRGSLTRAFKRTRSRKNSEGSQSDIERSSQNNGFNSNSLPGTPILCPKDLRRSSQSIFTLGDSMSYSSKHDEIESLKKQLRDKDRQLNEIRLEALLTASQMESMNDRLNQMKKEMATLRTENQRLQSALQRQSITSSFGSLTSCSEASTISGVERKIHLKLLDHLVGLVDVTHRTTWRQLDTKIRKIFDQYLRKIDQERLEMSTNCLISYCCGNDGIERQFGLERVRETHTPIEALSRGNHINLCLRSKLEYLAIETNSPKTILERITTTLKTFRRLVIGGPAHSGKYSLALRCCRFVLEEMGFELGPSSIASIDVLSDGHKEIESFLQNFLGCSVNTHPKGIIFKNIHNISEFGSLLAPLQQVNSSALASREFPLILCTLRCADGGPLVTNLKVHFQFQSFLCNRSMEPCKNFIGRILRKKAIGYELESINRGSPFDFDSISRIIDWLQQFHHRLNIFIMSFSQCSDDFDTETLLTCPMDMESIHEWFVNSWNLQIVPKVREMISNQTQSLDLNSFHDPSNWILESYPWNSDIDKTSINLKLLPIFENNTHTSCTKSRPDPIVDQLHDTLRKLQEVTNG